MNTLTPPSSPVADRILVVDDIEDNSTLLQVVLEQEGYDVEIASSGREALNKVEHQRPDLILLDVMMPGMNGFEVTQRIRQNDHIPFIPILLITGYDQFSSAEGYEFGADDFIRKPINLDLLLDRIRAILPEDRNS